MVLTRYPDDESWYTQDNFANSSDAVLKLLVGHDNIYKYHARQNFKAGTGTFSQYPLRFVSTNIFLPDENLSHDKRFLLIDVFQ